MNKHLKEIGIVILIMAFFVGCAHMTAQQQYLATRTTFNEILTQYIDFMGTQTPEKRAEIKADVQPVLDEAETALDTYGKAVKAGENADAKLDAYLSVKNQLVHLVLKYGLKVDEGKVTP